MGEVILLILGVVAALCAWHGVIYGVRIVHGKFRESKPKLYEVIRLTFWVVAFILIGSILAVASYFYFVNLESTFDALTFSRDVKALHLMLEADANILGGRFLLASFQAIISGFVVLVCFLLIVALPLASFIFIAFPVAAIFDFIAERKKIVGCNTDRALNNFVRRSR